MQKPTTYQVAEIGVFRNLEDESKVLQQLPWGRCCPSWASPRSKSLPRTALVSRVGVAPPRYDIGMALKPKSHPNYVTAEEVRELVAASPNHPVRMAMRIMLWTGLRVSVCLSLYAADLRLNQDPPVISLRPGVPPTTPSSGQFGPPEESTKK